MTISKHEIQATVEGVEYVSVPGYDIEHEEEVVYSEGFEDDQGGWSGYFAWQDSTYIRTGSHSFFVGNTDSAEPGDGTASRTFTGLTVGRSYTFSGWVTQGTTSQSTVGVTGMTSTSITGVPIGTFTQKSYTFTATATSHEIYFQTGGNSGGTGSRWDDLTLTADAFTEEVPPVIATSYPLDIIEAQLGMDDGWSPYIQGELVCSAPPEAALDLIDPRDNLRVSVTVTKRFGEPAVTVYSEEFDTEEDTDLRGWTSDAEWAYTFGGIFNIYESTGTGSTLTAFKTITDLTAGLSYTFTMEVAGYSDPGTATLGVTGIGATDSTAFTEQGTGFTTLSYTFTATAAEHELVVTGVCPGAATDIVLDNAQLTRNAVDWNAQPHENEERTFDLLLREREVDHNAGTMRVVLESDEALLQDFGLVALEAERVPGLSVKDAVTHALEKIGAELEAGAADADIEGDTFTNLHQNPSLGTASTDHWLAAGNSTITRSTTVFRDGLGSIRVQSSGAGGQTIVASRGIAPGAFTPVTPGASYTFSAYGKAAAVNGRTASIALRWYNASKVAIGSDVYGDTATTDTTAWTRLHVTSTAPAGAVYAYPILSVAGTAASEVHHWTDAMITADSGLIDFFDGDSPGAEWTGTAHASTSTLSMSDAMLWSPGDTAWDFLEPLFQSVNLRLYCDEERRWILEPSGTTREGQLNVAEGFNLTEGTDSISRYREWFDSVVVKYTGNRDVNNQRYTTYDVAGAPGTKVLTVEYDRASPGTGAAQAILDRALGRGRVLGLTGISTYTASPGMTVVATLPKSPVQTGLVSSIQWSFPENTMTIGSRALIDTSPDSWFFAPEDVAWEDIPDGTDWSEYDPEAF